MVTICLGSLAARAPCSLRGLQECAYHAYWIIRSCQQIAASVTLGVCKIVHRFRLSHRANAHTDAKTTAVVS